MSAFCEVCGRVVSEGRTRCVYHPEENDRPSPAHLAAQAAYISGVASATLVRDLEECHGLTLSDEARARLLVGIRPVVEPVVTRCLAQDAAVVAG